jgi:Rrf2 family protein
MNNTRFSVSLHILTLLARAGDELLSSEQIAASININPVLVRKELGNLRKQGLVASREGKNGGSYLNKPARDIYLSDIYLAVHQQELLAKSKNKPSTQCPVGKQINAHLTHLYNNVEKTLLTQLAKTTLRKFALQFG